MRVETGLSPALALKVVCVGKVCYFIILKRMCGLNTVINARFKLNSIIEHSHWIMQTSRCERIGFAQCIVILFIC